MDDLCIPFCTSWTICVYHFAPYGKFVYTPNCKHIFCSKGYETVNVGYEMVNVGYEINFWVRNDLLLIHQLMDRYYGSHLINRQ